MEPVYSGHHWEQQLEQGVRNSGASSIVPVGVVLCCRAVEHNVATFSEFSLAVHWQGDYAKAMVDDLAEKIDKYPLNRGHYVLFVYNWECEKCPLQEVARCLVFKGF